MIEQQTGAHRRPLFSLGQVVATPGAIQAFAATGERIAGYIAMHQCGESGQLDADDIHANEQALRCGARILSAYHLRDGTKVYVITEADRSSTCVLLPDEY